MNILKYLRRHRKNDDRPYAIEGATGLLLVLIFSVFALTVADHFALRYSNLAAVISSVLVDLANGDRGANKIGGLTVNPVLVVAAQAKANDMAAKGYFAHTSPDGKNPWYWFKEAGYSFSYAGENLAVDFSDSSDVEIAWMNSPAHRANILNNHFTEIGIATAVGTYEGRTTTFVVQEFGTPAPVSTLPVQTLASPTTATEPALATTARPPVKTPTKVATNPVLGASAEQPAATKTVALAVTSAGTPVVASTPVETQAGWWEHLLASPKTILWYVYLALALLIGALLLVTTGFEFKQHHKRHALAALALIILMVGLFSAASFYFFSAPVLAAPVTTSQ
jgi:hypothetical protein